MERKLSNMRRQSSVTGHSPTTVTHHDVVLWSGDGRQDVDAVRGKISSQLGPVVDPVTPARVHHAFACVFVQDDQIAFGKA